MPATAVKPTPEGRTPGVGTGDYLDTTVREIMTPGVVSITEDASLRHAYHALVAHSVHALLVVGRSQSKPLGWVTARGLLAWVDREAMVFARDAITEQPVTIEPSATARDALTALSQPGVSHLLVCHSPELAPEGVISEMNLMALASR